MITVCPKCDTGHGPCYHEYEKMLNESPSTAYFTFNPALGWMIFAFHAAAADMLPIKVCVSRDTQGNVKLLCLTGNYIKKPRIGRFCKRPHKLIYWPDYQTQVV